MSDPHDPPSTASATGRGAGASGRRAAATVFAAGDVVGGRYRVERFIARGGMGEVYEALDLALHETARRAVAMLHKGEWPLDVPRVEDLPGFDEWKSGGMGSPSWAAQLERLLGDAP